MKTASFQRRQQELLFVLGEETRMSFSWRFACLLAAACLAGGLAVTAAAAQPQLAEALSALSDASGYLAQTSDNKGGHPQKAMALIAKAEAEIRAAMQ
jgi:outer membrane lipoprotein-sorting protein